MKQLRAALKKVNTENKTLKTQVAEVSKQTRAQSLKTALEKHEAKPALAKYFPTDGEVSEDAVLAWLKEDGELFGWTPQEKPADTSADASAIRDISSLSPSGGADMAARAAAMAKTPTLGRDISSADAKEAASVADALLQQLSIGLR